MDKKKRITGKDLCSNIAFSILEQMAVLTEKELKAVIKAAGKLTETNCGWYAYQMRYILSLFAKNTILGRKAIKAKKKKEKKI